MVFLVSDVGAEAASLLNDAPQTMYTNDILLPFIKKAWREIEAKFVELGIPPVEEISAPITVGVSAVESVVTLPADLLSPILLWERQVGETDAQWVEMEEKRDLPIMTPTSRLQYWEWREEAINVPACTQGNQVKIKYYRMLTALTGPSSSIGGVNGAISFLAARSAALAAQNIGENEGRAKQLDGDAGGQMEVLINTKILEMQNLSVRRLPYRGRR